MLRSRAFVVAVNGAVHPACYLSLQAHKFSTEGRGNFKFGGNIHHCTCNRHPTSGRKVLKFTGDRILESMLRIVFHCAVVLMAAIAAEQCLCYYE